MQKKIFRRPGVAFPIVYQDIELSLVDQHEQAAAPAAIAANVQVFHGVGAFGFAPVVTLVQAFDELVLALLVNAVVRQMGDALNERVSGACHRDPGRGSGPFCRGAGAERGE